jgi:hypothetical protein
MLLRPTLKTLIRRPKAAKSGFSLISKSAYLPSFDGTRDG